MILPILHGRADGPFLTAWTFPPTLTLGLLFAAALYGLALRAARRAGRPTPPSWQVGSYYAGLLTTAVALLGPLDTWNDELFFLHMAQHLVLIQVAAPLLLLGRPVQVILRGLPARRTKAVLGGVLRRRVSRWVLTALTHPAVAFVLFNASMVLWHLPSLYNAALENDLVHDLEHAFFFGTALIYWWAIIEPVPRHHKLKLHWALVSLFFSMIIGSAVGAILTLADNPVYAYYVGAPRVWGLSVMDDQQIGGLLMWVVGGLVYSGIMLGMFIAALNRDAEPEDTSDEVEAAEEWAAEPRHFSRPA